MTITLTREEAQHVLDLMTRYRTETPLGHQPHMISHKADEAIETLRARLSEPEPEPLEYWNAVEGWVNLDEVRQHFDSVSCGTIYKKPGKGRQPLYHAPPQREWQGLTDEEIRKLSDACAGVRDETEFIRAIETKLKEKNT
jgi:hypothetical protein